MTPFPLRYLVSFSATLLLSLCAGAQDTAPDFPLGRFADGKSYQLSDYRGKVVVLYFYESQCPRCKGAVPERNEVVKAFEGKPVKFIAVGAGDTLDAVTGYGRETGLKMPIFADSLGLMEARYGQKISLENIWQFRVIGPDGAIVGNTMDKATIEKALEKAAWKYDPKDYDPKLKAALDAFEWNQWDAGMKLLAPLRRSPVKPVAESANKLYDALKAEADAWKTEAEKAVETDPVAAYDLYTKVTTHFPTEANFKGAQEAKQKLAVNKAVVAELNARRAYAPIGTAVAAATAAQKAQVLQQLRTFTKKHSGTPTGDKVSALVKELEK
ncbi:peroxiredoxin family protein [Gemmata sp.]|uniref:peroxiredoxin family protein n=1 Tax=Gemmata sp. TaxID=1914242 RepID=UPI003F710FE3